MCNDITYVGATTADATADATADERLEPKMQARGTSVFLLLVHKNENRA